MSGRKAKQARRLENEGQPYFKEIKRPTTAYVPRKEQQERRRRERASAKRAAETSAKMLSAFTRGREKGLS
jgi:hypothetical protein